MTDAQPARGRLLITGANGFLGSGIIREALAMGLSLIATDRQERASITGVEYRRGDVLEAASLQDVFRGANLVVHAAGLAHVFDRPEAAPFKAVNETGTANIARAAVSVGVRHFLLVSSVSVYGDHAASGIDETAPCGPEGPYADSKWQAEQRAAEILVPAGIPLTVLRLATLYGEGDPGNVARLMRWIDSGRFVWIGDGSNSKSLLHRDDAARACLVAALAPRQSPGRAVFNVSAPPCIMREVALGLAEALNRPLPRWHVSATLVRRLANIGVSLAGSSSKAGARCRTLQKWLADDIYEASRFNKEFSFQTRVSLIEGLRREVEWYRKNRG